MLFSNTKIKKYIYSVLSGIIYILLFISCYSGTRSFWFTQDGGFTFALIHKSFPNIIRLTSLDVHPFFYYFIAKIFISPFKSIFNQIIALRILSALPYLALLIIGNTTLRRRFGMAVSLLFMALITTMPVLVSYISILRMYSLSLLLVTVTFLMFVYVYKHFISNSFKSFLIISFFSLCAAYCHYYALIMVAIMYLMFFVLFIYKQRRIKYLIYSVIIDIILFSPWFMILIKQTIHRGTYTAGPITVKNVISNVIDIACPIHDNIFMHGFVLLLFLLIVISFFLCREYLNPIVVIGFGIYIFTSLFGIIFSVLTHQSYVIPRYLMPSLGAFWLSVAIIIRDLKKKSLLKYFIVGILLIIGLMSYTSNLMSLKNNKITNDTVKAIERVPKNSTIVYDGNVCNFVSAYHSEGNIFLTKRHNNYYTKVFSMRFKKRLSNNDRRKVYFAKPVNGGNVFSHKFNLKYGSKFKDGKVIYLPNFVDTKMEKCVLYRFYLN